MFGFEPVPAIAGGQIRPSRFVKISTAADHTLLEADANEMAVGISAPGTRDAPLDGASGDIASTGDQFEYSPEGTVCLLEIGTGGVTRGAEIKSDADGKGVLALTSGTTNQWVGAIALESAVETEFARVLVKVYPHIYAS
jgi:hypothetical protein